MPPRAKPMTAAELRRLPVAVNLPTAARALSLGLTSAYVMAKQGQFPVPLIKVGGQYRVRRADLMTLLGVSERA